MKYQDFETLPQVSQLKLDLIAAKSVIDTPDKWCRGNEVCREGVWQRCAYWALVAAIGTTVVEGRLGSAIAALTSQYGNNGKLQGWQDRHTHIELMALWDKAIARA